MLWLQKRQPVPFIQEMVNTDFVGAVHWLVDRYGLTILETVAGATALPANSVDNGGNKAKNCSTKQQTGTITCSGSRKPKKRAPICKAGKSTMRPSKNST